jgi:hypothetical protein
MIRVRNRRWDKAVIRDGCGDGPLITAVHVILNRLGWRRMAISSGGERKMPRLVSQAAMFNNTWHLALPLFFSLLTLLFSPRLLITLDRGIFDCD